MYIWMILRVGQCLVSCFEMSVTEIAANRSDALVKFSTPYFGTRWSVWSGFRGQNRQSSDEGMHTRRGLLCFSRCLVIDSCFFEDKNVTSQRYITSFSNKLRTCWRTQFREQQVGAICPHTARFTGCVWYMFPGRLNSSRGTWGSQHAHPIWACDSFLWSYLKDKVFKHRLNALEEANQIIIIQAIQYLVSKCDWKLEKSSLPIFSPWWPPFILKIYYQDN